MSQNATAPTAPAAGATAPAATRAGISGITGWADTPVIPDTAVKADTALLANTADIADGVVLADPAVLADATDVAGTADFAGISDFGGVAGVAGIPDFAGIADFAGVGDVAGIADDPTDADLTAIAVVGMAGRFPGAADLDAFWRNLRDGVDCISHFSDAQMRAAGVPGELLADPRYVKAAGALDGVEEFDAPFFGYSPGETELIDPQQRLFLECAWQALESAGYNPEGCTVPVGVFGGVGMNNYLLQSLQRGRVALDPLAGIQGTIGNDKDFLTTRVSYKLNLRGPSINVQSACSTGLVAVAMACQSLVDYQCDLALAGGASLGNLPRSGYLYQEGGILSPDGRCRPFDAAAQGTVGGDGAGVVVLKRLADALAEGDTVRAVIRGWAVNNDGARKAGYTAPGVQGQAEVIAMAMAVAGVDPASITYVEAHGTGTPLGDPIEIAALTRAFGAAASSQPNAPGGPHGATDSNGAQGPNGAQSSNGAAGPHCAVGSVKSNIGHLDVAAGVAGLIKTVLALEHRLIPATLHFERPNPAIDFAASPFYVNRELAAWRTGGGPRRAGVSSFGIGGTNAHVVLEEAPARAAAAAPAVERPWELLVVSARTAGALEAAAGNLAAALERNPAPALADVANTLRVGRKVCEHRRIAVCRSHREGAAALTGGEPRRAFTAAAPATEAQVVFLFPGVGAQHGGMGAEIYRREPRFRAEIDRCARLLGPHLGFDFRALLVDAPEKIEAASARLLRPRFAMPALFAVEYALAQLWMSWGVRPRALLGHSLGEYVAACLAGVLSLPDALGLVALRGRLLDGLGAMFGGAGGAEGTAEAAETAGTGGAMLGVALPAEEVRGLLGAELSLAAINGPAQAVVSGPATAVAALADRLAARGVEVRRVEIEAACHSRLVAPIVPEFAAAVERIELHPPAIPLLSNVTGSWLGADDATDPGYWVRHLEQTVLFDDCLRQLRGEPDRLLLEVGPGRTLCTLARLQGPGAWRAALPSMRHPRDAESDEAHLLHTAGRLWALGAAIDWHAFAGDASCRRVPLPTYPFERRRYSLLEPAETGTAAHHPAAKDRGRAASQSPGAAFTPGSSAAGAPAGAARITVSWEGCSPEAAEEALEILGRALRGAAAGNLEIAGGEAATSAPASHAPRAPLAGMARLAPTGLMAQVAPTAPMAQMPQMAQMSQMAQMGPLDLLAQMAPLPVMAPTAPMAQLSPMSPRAPLEPLEALAPLEATAARAPLETRASLETPESLESPEALAPPPSSAPPARSSHHPRPAALGLYLAPASALESQLAALWEDLLGIAPIGVNDDFFELGGHSLLAGRLAARARQTLGLHLPMRSLFECPTIAQLARNLLAAGPANTATAASTATTANTAATATTATTANTASANTTASATPPATAAPTATTTTMASATNPAIPANAPHAPNPANAPHTPIPAIPARPAIPASPAIAPPPILATALNPATPSSAPVTASHANATAPARTPGAPHAEDAAATAGAEDPAAAASAAGAAVRPGIVAPPDWAPPLLPAPRDGDLPLSFPQQRLWFLDQLAPGDASWNVPLAVRLTGALAVPALARGLAEIVRRHEVLRTTFEAVQGRARQVIRPPGRGALPVVDLAALAPAAGAAEAKRLTAAEAAAPFDLCRGPLLRCRLLRQTAADHVLLVTLHHIAADGGSAIVLVDELQALYAAFAAGRPSPLPALALQYADFAVWQRQWLTGAAIERQLAYWRGRLAGAPSLALPTDHPRRPPRPGQRGRAARRPFTIAAPLRQRLEALGRQEGATMLMTLLAAWDTLLHHTSGEGDVVVGLDIADRDRPEVEPLIGCFINQVVLRVDVAAAASFREVIRRVRGVVLEAFENRDLPFENLVADLAPGHDLSRTPLFQVKVAFQRTPAEATAPGLAVTLLEPPVAAPRFDLTLFLHDTGSEIAGALEYNADLFESEGIGRLAERFQELLERLTAQPDNSLGILRDDLASSDRERRRQDGARFAAASLQKLVGQRGRAPAASDAAPRAERGMR